MKKLIFIFVILLTVGFTSSTLDYTAQGKPIWETNSDKVCGDKLCSEVQSTDGEYEIFKIQDKQYSELLYFMSNENEIENVIIDYDANSMIIQINAISDGEISFVIPGHLFESGYFAECEKELLFFLIDGAESNYQSMQTADGVLVTLAFTQNSSEIEFIGSGTPESLLEKQNCINSSIAKLPPRQQINYVTVDEIICKQGFELIFKPNSNLPSCVTQSSAERLVLRGWSVSGINSFENCVLAGNPVIESYPRQCRTGDGKHFVEEIEDIPTDYMITEIIDGDTVKVNGESVRFALASAPELNQPGGVEARSFIANLCPSGSFVSVDEDEGQPEGSYGRMIAVIYCNDKNLNAELLDAGLGKLSAEFCGVSEFAGETWAQKHGCGTKPIACTKEHRPVCGIDEKTYSNSCMASAASIDIAYEGECKANCEIACLVYDPVCGDNGITYACGVIEAECNGVEISHVGECKVELSSQSQTKCDPSYPDVCIPPYPPDLDCGEISYKNFRVVGSDPHRFDGDKDGIGCES